MTGSMVWARRELCGWGRHPRVESAVTRAERPGDLEAALAEARRHPEEGLLVHGLGRSYGDVALLEGGRVVLSPRLDRVLGFDEETGTLEAEAGVSLADLLTVFLERGWYPPVMPGTKFVTLGGAVANDIHGKNHHADGTFTDHVDWIDLLTADGRVVRTSREQEAELFHATVGGLGLTGAILRLRLRLRRTTGPWFETESIRIRDLDHFLEVSSQSHDHPHVVTWIDTLARGRRLGRGILMRGRQAPEGVTGRRGLLQRLPLSVPVDLPSWVLNSFSLRVFNEGFFRKQWRSRSRSVVHVEPWYFPLDAIHHWNRGYGRRGLIQYQLVVPPDPGQGAIRRIVEMIAAAGYGSFLSVLKEFGEGEHGGLSFPMPGTTLALDFPHYGSGLLELLERVDRVVVDAGGRVYLAKDARLGRDMFRAMYPRWSEWKAVRDRWDPQGIFQSRMGRRLGLTAGAAT